MEGALAEGGGVAKDVHQGARRLGPAQQSGHFAGGGGGGVVNGGFGAGGDERLGFKKKTRGIKKKQSPI